MRFYVSAFRGTPLFVQIMVVHFALVPLFINPRDGLLVTSGLMSADFARELRASYGAFLSCIVAITLNAGAYVSEIFRAGIQSIDKGADGGLPRAGPAVVENHAQGDPAAGVSPHSAAAGQ
ncbi:Amino acid ABC transporter [Klebsiella pneumoniae]|uniref:Amino acid ABC transporter n=1 Tax=Klebsiella pneumoniae TaxID=573 RepID=A0A378H211_KLEPN|nr:Amino acid ABC transporter [Klebsiella pneumoniae]